MLLQYITYVVVLYVSSIAIVISMFIFVYSRCHVGDEGVARLQRQAAGQLGLLQALIADLVILVIIIMVITMMIIVVLM